MDQVSLDKAKAVHEECMKRYPVEERVSFEECTNPLCEAAREASK